MEQERMRDADLFGDLLETETVRPRPATSRIRSRMSAFGAGAAGFFLVGFFGIGDLDSRPFSTALTNLSALH
jgi:hypothetical protein